MSASPIKSTAPVQPAPSMGKDDQAIDPLVKKTAVLALSKLEANAREEGARQLLRDAKTFIIQEETQEAIWSVYEGLKLTSDKELQAELYLQLASAYKKNESHPEALNAATSGLTCAPKNRSVKNQLATVQCASLFNLDKHDKVIETASQTLGWEGIEDDLKASLYYYIFWAQNHLQETDSAIKAGSTVLQLNLSEPIKLVSVCEALAQLYLEKKDPDYEAAIQMALRALQYEEIPLQQILNLKLLLVESYLETKKYSQALKEVTEAIEFNPSGKLLGDFYFYLIQIHLGLKEYNLAETAAREALRKDLPPHLKAEFYNELSYALRLQEKYNEAMDAANLALTFEDIHPSVRGNTYHQIAEIFLEKDEYAKSEEAAEKGIEETVFSTDFSTVSALHLSLAKALYYQLFKHPDKAGKAILAAEAGIEAAQKTRYQDTLEMLNFCLSQIYRFQRMLLRMKQPSRYGIEE